MPDLGNLLNSSSITVTRCPNLKPVTDQCDSSACLNPNTVKTVGGDDNWQFNWDKSPQFPVLREGDVCNGNVIRILRRCRGSGGHTSKSSGTKRLDSYVKMESGVPEQKCFLPFLVGAPKLAECHVCQKLIYPGGEVLCSVRGCQGAYHLTCAKERLGFSSSRKFKCPQHACFLCKQKFQLWRCARCQLASHDKCAAFPEHVLKFHDQPGWAICWKHHSDWRLEKKCAVPTNDIEEIFCRLPIPYVEEDFKIDFTWKDMMENKLEPPPYVHIRRNVYLVKKKRDDVDTDIGCTNCSSTTCSEDCVCRVQCISCSKACRCSEMCTNRPFRKDKKIKIVKLTYCAMEVHNFS